MTPSSWLISFTFKWVQPTFVLKVSDRPGLYIHVLCSVSDWYGQSEIGLWKQECHSCRVVVFTYMITFCLLYPVLYSIWESVPGEKDKRSRWRETVCYEGQCSVMWCCAYTHPSSVETHTRYFILEIMIIKGAGPNLIACKCIAQTFFGWGSDVHSLSDLSHKWTHPCVVKGVMCINGGESRVGGSLLSLCLHS